MRRIVAKAITLLRMISITRSEIPPYLQDSAFYRALSEEDDEVIAVNQENLKRNLDIHSVEDLHHHLQTMRFWGSSRLFDELLTYCFYNVDKTEVKHAAEQFPELHEFGCLAKIVENDKRYWMRKAFASECLDIITFLHRNGNAITASDAIEAIRAGSAVCLAFAIDHGCPAETAIVNEAAASGRKDLVELCIVRGYPCAARILAHAAKRGTVTLLQYLRDRGCPWIVEVCASAAANNNLECLRYAHENGCPWDGTVCSAAADGGHLECLTYARTHGCPWTKETAISAARNGHLPCLTCALLNGCMRSDEDICRAAVMCDSLECLQFAQAQGCALPRDLPDFCAEQGSLQCLMYAVLQNLPMSRSIMAAAACTDSVDVIRYLRGIGIEWHWDTLSNAAFHNRQKTLLYALENGAPRKSDLLKSAAGPGHLSCIQILLDHGCQWMHS
jgi:hypothetical protein